MDVQGSNTFINFDRVWQFLLVKHMRRSINSGRRERGAKIICREINYLLACRFLGKFSFFFLPTCSAHNVAKVFSTVKILRFVAHKLQSAIMVSTPVYVFIITIIYR